MTASLRLGLQRVCGYTNVWRRTVNTRAVFNSVRDLDQLSEAAACVRMRGSVAVVGAGVIGLSTAVQLQAALPDVRVTVIADKFNTDTVSDGAAGLYRPTADYIPGVTRPTLRQWCVDSHEHYMRVAHSEAAAAAGVGIISGYHFFSPGSEEKDSLYREVVTDFRTVTKDEILKYYPSVTHCSSGYQYRTVIVECRWYLPWLMERFKANGGKVEARTVDNFSEFVGRYDVVVNCTGERSRQLLGDLQLQPIRGQMIRVKAPWVKHFVYVDHNCWIIPGKETVTIGGTRQEGDSSLQVAEQDSKDVWRRACAVMPSLLGAEWAWQWVGMRPVRKPVRLEAEALPTSRGLLQVVHNYGHGGNGVSLSWGCGKHAVRLVGELLQRPAAKL